MPLDKDKKKEIIEERRKIKEAQKTKYEELTEFNFDPSTPYCTWKKTGKVDEELKPKIISYLHTQCKETKRRLKAAKGEVEYYESEQKISSLAKWK